MLNQLAISLLSDAQRMSAGDIRFFLRLLRDYDLRRFVAIGSNSWDGRSQQKHLTSLVQIGLLETGPVVQTSRLGEHRVHRHAVKIRTYRLARPYLLTGQELRDWCQENGEILRRRRRSFGTSQAQQEPDPGDDVEDSEGERSLDQESEQDAAE